VALPALLTQMMLDHPIGLWALTDLAGSSVAADINPTETGPRSPGTPTSVVFGANGAPISGLTSASFNGTTSHIAVPFSPALAPAVFTLETLFFVNANPSTTRCLFSTEQLDDSRGAKLLMDANGTLYLQLNGEGQASGVAAPLSNWHHLVGTYDGSNASLFRDGNLIGGPNAMGFLPNTNGAIQIGCNGDGANAFFPGLLFGCSLYNYALTPAQIANHYNAWQQATPEFYVPFPSGFQPWDVAGFGSINAWYTENYQGGGFGSPPTLRQSTIVGLVTGNPNIKYWALPSAINPLG